MVLVKSIVFDIADNWGYSFVGIRSVDFYKGDTKILLTESDYEAYATTTYNDAEYGARFAFDTSTSKVGDYTYTSWISLNNSQNSQRLIIVFNVPQNIDKVVINNQHHYGGVTTSGAKNTVITASASDVTDVTYNAAIPNPTVLFTGEIPEHVAQDIEDDFIIEIGATPRTSLLAFLEQSYGDHIVYLAKYLEMSYEDAGYILTYLVQTYGLSLGASLQMLYNDQAVLTSILNQFYGDARPLQKVLVSVYADVQMLRSSLEQPYSSLKEFQSALAQVYSILGSSNKVFLDSLYSLQGTDTLSKTLQAVYNLQEEGGLIANTSSLIIDGVSVPFKGYTIERHLDRYGIIVDVDLMDATYWNGLLKLQKVTVIDDGLAFELLIDTFTGKSKFGIKTYGFSAVSPALKLDSPYADLITSDFRVGLISETARNLAALGNIELTWEVPADGLLDPTVTDFTGGTPMSALQTIASAVGGAVQSNPNGSLSVIPLRATDSDKINQGATDYTLDTSINFETLEATTVPSLGYNVFNVSNIDESSKEYSDFEQVEIDSHTSLIKSYQVPWTDDEVYLTTSEVTNIVGIERLPDVIDEYLCEDVEVVEGAGDLLKPFNGLIDYDYQTSENLGILTISEDGSFSTAVEGESTARVKYFSRYRQWKVTHSGNLQAQFILRSV